MVAATREVTTSVRRAHGTLPERVDVAIVGSGLGGLVAGATLAQAGQSVAVFESHYTAGGCATHFERGPKRARYRFDVGLHYIGDCGEEGQIPRILRKLGIELGYAPLDPDGFDTLVFPDFRFRIPVGIERYRERLVEMFPRERRAIDKYVKLLSAVEVATRFQDREAKGRPPVKDMIALAAAGLRLAPHRTATIADVFESIDARDPALRGVLLGQSGDYGLPPSKVSAFLHLGLAAHYFRGAYYPKGGGQIIADRLCERIESLGGSVHLRHPIERIVVRDGRATGVRVAPRQGEAAREVRADVVLSNADLKKTLLELVGPAHLPASWVGRAAGFEMAAALFMTFLGVTGDMRDAGMGATNYWQFDGVDMESFYRASGRDSGTGPIRPYGCYVTSASLKDPEHALHHAPAGVTNVEVMTIVPGSFDRWNVAAQAIPGWDYKRNDGYHAVKAQIEEDMVRRFDALFPGSASRIVFRESATPVSHARYTGATGGTGYGLAATPDQFLRDRPGYRAPIGGLYFAGASTRAGHGIVGAMSSGQAAAARILKDVRARTHAG